MGMSARVRASRCLLDHLSHSEGGQGDRGVIHPPETLMEVTGCFLIALG